ncbi:MAG: sulfotransferase [Desulfobacteraceae bacterium]|nr:sulfotransferase [Desulfobacteraceae bacterium]
MKEFLDDLKVEHTKFNPIMIIGKARSGTSIFTRLVRKYLRISFGTESQFFIRYYDSLKNYEPLSDDANIKTLINDISKERYFKRSSKRYGFVLDTKAVFENLPENSYRGVLVSIFSQLAKHHKMERWGDKTPEYIHDLPILKELFPDAQFIHVVRDGRDVALSSFRMPFGEKNIYKAALDWKASILAARHFAKTVSEDQYTELRYEDVLTNPTGEFSKIIRFLGIKDDDNQLINFISDSIENDLNLGNFEKWKYQLTKDEIYLFERIAGDLLDEYGYDSKIKTPLPMPGYEKLFWEFDNNVRKLKMGEYWEDNFYKLILRYKALLRRFLK